MYLHVIGCKKYQTDLDEGLVCWPSWKLAENVCKSYALFCGMFITFFKRRIDYESWSSANLIFFIYFLILEFVYGVCCMPSCYWAVNDGKILTAIKCRQGKTFSPDGNTPCQIVIVKAQERTDNTGGVGSCWSNVAFVILWAFRARYFHLALTSIHCA